jgi:hypothetical protein
VGTPDLGALDHRKEDDYLGASYPGKAAEYKGSG